MKRFEHVIDMEKRYIRGVPHSEDFQLFNLAAIQVMIDPCDKNMNSHIRVTIFVQAKSGKF